MGGYLARAKPAEDIHDPLFARALVLDDGEKRVAVVAADLLGFDRAMARSLRERIAEATGIPASHIMLTCSHTHSGPLIVRTRIGHADRSYVESLQGKLVAVVRAAAEDLQPVRVGAGRAKVYLGVNRRQRTEDNRVVLGTNPEGYAYPYAHILDVAKENGGPLAMLFTYGAHPVVLGPKNLHISGDYAGMAEREVEENFGGQAVALFALGFAGDVNVEFDKRNFSEVETCGVALARAVLEEWKDIELASDLTLQARTTLVPLPLEAPPQPGEAERILYDAREQLTSMLGRGEDEAAIHHRRAMVEWASELVDTAGADDPEPTAELEIQGLAIGPVALLGLSAEVFAEYAKGLDEVSPFEHTFPISNANGAIGYLPTAAAFDEGGYEVETAPRLFGALGFQPQVESLVREAMGRVLRELGGGEAPPGEG